MNKMKTMLLAGVASLLLCGANPAAADGTAPTDTQQSTTTHNPDGTSVAVSVPTQNGSQNYLDDRMMWNRSIPAWSYEQLTKDPTHADYCLPATTTVIGESSQFYTATKSGTPAPPAGAAADAAPAAPISSSGQYLPVVVDSGHFLYGIFGGYDLRDANYKLDPKNHKKPDNWEDADAPYLCNGVKTIKNTQGQDINSPLGSDKLYIAQGDMDDTIRFGWDYGALVVPFKIQLSGTHALSSSSTLGGYFGYRFPLSDWGLVFSPVIFGGASNISTSQTVNGTTTSQTVAGLSYGGGVITRIKDTNFQIGLIFGSDHVDSAQPYQYNDKIWMSFEIGYSFAQ